MFHPIVLFLCVLVFATEHVSLEMRCAYEQLAQSIFGAYAEHQYLFV